MNHLESLKVTIALATVATIAACGGGGGDITPTPPPPPNNSAPSSNAGADQSVDELSAVTLDGSGSSDPDGDTITYTWSQTGGTSVTLSNTDMAQATFDAPDVTAGSMTDVLTFQLQVGDGSLTNTDTVTVTANDIGVGINTPPTAVAGPDQTVGRMATVNLDGSASSDLDGTALTFAWLQTAGTAVTLSDAAVAQPSFTSPDIVGPEVLTFELTVTDGTDNAVDSVDITVQDALAMVDVSGVLSFEFVLPNANCGGLDLNNPDVRPIRGVTVQLFDSADTLLATTTSGSDGSYAFSDIDASLDVYVRARAELKSSAPAVWDVEVRDNVDTSGAPPALASRPLYVVDFPEFNTGVADVADADYTATTGWNGAAYTGARQAAPFAILDALMDAMEMVTAVDPTTTFAPLDAFWSVNNTLVSPTDIDAGELGASFYRGDLDSLFLLGDANVDTEEFDDHVTVHEWGHYFEDNFSRSDSLGGPHGIGQSLDPRLAFGEGFATALAAIALDEPQYCDTSAPLTTGGFGLDTEGGNFGIKGFFNEMSVATFIYDMVDTNVDGTDNNSVGFGPIYDVMTGPQITTPALTSLFSFATELRSAVDPADVAFVDSQLTRENIDVGTVDMYGSGQTTVPAGSRDVVPVYTDLPINGTLINLCANSDNTAGTDGNKLSERRYLKFSTTGSSTYDVSVAANPVPPATTDPAPTPPDEIRDRSDPDIEIFQDGSLIESSTSADDDAESFTTGTLAAGDYVMVITEWRYQDEEASSDFPTQVCFDVTMAP